MWVLIVLCTQAIKFGLFFVIWVVVIALFDFNGCLGLVLARDVVSVWTLLLLVICYCGYCALGFWF